FTAVSDAYKRITGIENVPVHKTPEGAFFQYGYFQYGVLSFSTLGWGVAAAGGGQRARPAAAPEAAATPPAGAAGARAGGAGARAGGAGGAGASQARGGSGSGGDILSALEGAGIDAFVDWSTFQHPDLGEVEIGGFIPYATTNPPRGADRRPGRQAW
ncbi:hypothetical protein ACFL5A_04355, partial [Gemmatimonadota bacterium]